MGSLCFGSYIRKVLLKFFHTNMKWIRRNCKTFIWLHPAIHHYEWFWTGNLAIDSKFWDAWLSSHVQGVRECDDLWLVIKVKLNQTKMFGVIIGRIVDANTLRTRIFYAGVEPNIRKEAWKFLLGMYPKGSTSAYRSNLLAKRCEEYTHLKAQWTSITEKQAAK